jgi:polyphenol oxidase
MKVAPALPHGVEQVAERAVDGDIHVHGDWLEEFAWLIQGTTGRPHDMSLFGDAAAGDVLRRWTALREALGCSAAVHARQVHEAAVHVHDVVPPGLLVAPDADGHCTAVPGLMLAVSVADCVPVSLIAPARRAIALLHAGWRGVAAGILERGVATLAERFGAHAAGLRVHLGPAICGSCYQVGSEVPRALGLPNDSGHVDLRAALANRAVAVGVPASSITVSAHCTRHGGSPFHSHRAGCAERQIAVLAVAVP